MSKVNPRTATTGTKTVVCPLCDLSITMPIVYDDTGESEPIASLYEVHLHKEHEDWFADKPANRIGIPFPRTTHINGKAL